VKRFFLSLDRVALFARLGSLITAALVTWLLLAILGETPMVLFSAFKNTLFTGFGIGHTLYYATPLIFTGLSVALCAQAGLFNIGGEGQLYIGSLGIIAASFLFPGLPSLLAVLLGIFAAALAGGLWGGLAGALKAWRGSHEVIVTILLNFVGMSLTSYFILGVFKNPEEQGPESVFLSPGYDLHPLDFYLKKLGLEFFDSTPVNSSLFLALAACFLCHVLLFRTVLGHEIRAVGRNQRASLFAGIRVPFTIFITLFLGGALSGLVGVNEVMGYQHRLVDGFSPGYGFMGIPVALLVRNRPLLVPLSALLFGALQNSTREVEFLSDKISKELSVVLQGVLILCIAAEPLYRHYIARRKEKSA
jgi:general nucleoside transport system permease protein